MSETVKLTVNRIEGIEPWSGTKMVVSLRVDDRPSLLEELEKQGLLQEPDENDDMVDATDFEALMKKVTWEHSIDDVLDYILQSDRDDFLEWVRDNKEELEKE